MDAVDRSIVNLLQDGIPICDRPFADAASRLGISESELLARLTALRADGTLSRFGPMYNAEEFGGAVSLAAVAVSAADFDAVAATVRRWIEGQTFAPRTGDSGVHLVDSESARFGDFEAVQLAGLVDEIGRAHV